MQDTNHPISSPAYLGYRWPAEWERHEGTWLSWPHNPATWPGSLDEVEHFYENLIGAIAADETVYLNVNDDMTQRRVATRLQAGGICGEVRFLMIPTNDAWSRDYGPTVLRLDQEDAPLPRRLAVNWEYNAWGKKYPPFDADVAAALGMASAVEIPIVAGGIVAEGGAIDGNGAGLLMTTASCLLNSNRNPDATRALLEDRFREMLGIQEVLWLAGQLPGDDTDGHIDNLARFVDARTVLCLDPVSGSVSEAGTRELAANQEVLESWRGADGERLRVIRLPLPDPVFVDGIRLPASYANFYLTNHSVLLPQFQCHQDLLAQEILAGCFPNRRIVGIDCTHAIRGLGAIHCLTQQIPSAT